MNRRNALKAAIGGLAAAVWPWKRPDRIIARSARYFCYTIPMKGHSIVDGRPIEVEWPVIGTELFVHDGLPYLNDDGEWRREKRLVAIVHHHDKSVEWIDPSAKWVLT